MSLATKLKLLALLAHVIFFFGLYEVISLGHYYWFIPAFMCSLFVGVVGFNVALHRYFAHRSFKTTKAKENILAAISLLCGIGSPTSWCSIHRLHHVTADKEGDPHNPRVNGNLANWFNVWKNTPQLKRTYYRGLNSTKTLKLVHKHYFKYHLVLAVGLSLISLPLAFAVYAMPVVWCFHGSAAIAVISHRWGYRNHETKDMSYNNLLATILSMGEGWHNNHHANAGSYRQGEKWWELDPPAWVIEKFFLTK